MTDKLLNLSKPWSNEADLNIGGEAEPLAPLSPKVWSNSADLNLWVEWSGDSDLELGRLIKPVSPKKWSNSADINLTVEWSDKADLELGKLPIGDTPPVTVIECIGYSVNQPPKSFATVNLLVDVSAGCELLAPTTDHQIGFDINVWRGVISDVATVNNQSTKRHITNNNHFSDSPSLPVGKMHLASQGQKLTTAVNDNFASMPKLTSNVQVEADNGTKLTTAVSHARNRMDKVNNAVIEQFGHSPDVGNMVTSSYLHPPRADCSVAQKWQDAELLHKQINTDFNDGLTVHKEWGSYFEEGIYPTGFRPVIPPIVIPEKPLPADLDINVLWSNKADLEFVRIELDALIIMNTVIMYHTSKLGERTYINPVSWAVSNDLDSFAWTLNCSLYDNGILDLITTDDTFTLEVNDVKWNFNAFKYKRLQDGQFSGYSVTFVSKTQQLGYPLAQPVNVSLDAPKGALQLVEEVLGDVPLINKGVNEWTLQADTIEMMQAEPKAIISEILKASGAVMLPSVSGESIMIQPRYKVASWLMNELTDAECDVLLDGNYMVTDSGEIRNGVEYNAVTISGEKSGTVTKVVLGGTAGDVEATDYTTQIHQDHNVGLEYAKKVFSENGTIELAEISVGLDDNLLQSGSIVRIKHTDGDRTGISLGVTVKGDRVENVIQTATIEFRL